MEMADKENADHVEMADKENADHVEMADRKGGAAPEEGC